MTTEHTVVRSGKSKRKPFNSNVADHLLIYRDLYLQLPPCAERHIQHRHMRFYRFVPGARFNAFAIFLAPAFCFARDFS
jgi:hypothetical protein